MRHWPLVVAIAVFVLVEAPGLWHAEPNDEWVYFLMARQVSHGLIPYRDFFYAHPPFQLMLYLFPSLLGFSAIKLVPLISIIASGALVYLIASRHGRLAGAFSAILFFTSFSLMLEATYGLGVCEATALLMAGIFLYLRKRPLSSGIFLGLAALTRTYAVVPAGILLGFALLSARRPGLKAVMGFAISFALPVMFLAIAFGSGFIDPVIRYHFLKPHLASNTMGIFATFAKRNIPLLAAAAVRLALPIRKRLMAFIALAFGYILFLLILNRIFNFYFVMAIPFLAIIGGAGISALWKGRVRLIVAAGLCILLYLFVTDSLYLRKVDFSPFETGRELDGYIGKGTITGNDDIASLLAFQGGLSTCENLMDTNPQRVQAGLLPLDRTLYLMKGCDYVVLRPLEGFGSLPGAVAFMQENCKMLHRSDDLLLGTFLLYSCRGVLETGG